jgi:hypothetical protein
VARSQTRYPSVMSLYQPIAGRYGDREPGIVP